MKATLLLLAAFAGDPGLEATETATTAEDPHRVEWGTIPGVALDSALGFGIANLLNIAQLDPAVQPYAWRITLLTQVFLGRNSEDAIRPTLQRHRLRFDMPRFVQPSLRLSAELGFFRLINAGYYGLGNASVAQTPWAGLESGTEAYDAARKFHEYDRITPWARINLRIDVGDELELFAGGQLAWNWTNVFAGSRLEQDAAGPDRPVGLERHGRLEGVLGLIFEARDDEIDPDSGPFYEASLRVGQLIEVPGTYGGVNLTLRHFVPLWRPHLVLAARFVADALFGDAPLYELSRFGGLTPGDGIAGPLAVRGPRVQRYHGKVKVFANLELRSRILRFSLFDTPTEVGLVAFADAGRVWAELRPRPDLDGTGLGMRYAVGGGFRYRFGSALVVRGDLGWSPDGVLFSVDAGHVF